MEYRYEPKVCETHKGYVPYPIWMDTDEGYPLGRDEAPCIYAWITVKKTETKEALETWTSSTYEIVTRWVEHDFFFVCAIHGLIQETLARVQMNNQNRDRWAAQHEEKVQAWGDHKFRPWEYEKRAIPFSGSRSLQTVQRASMPMQPGTPVIIGRNGYAEPAKPGGIAIGTVVGEVGDQSMVVVQMT